MEKVPLVEQYFGAKSGVCEHIILNYDPAFPQIHNEVTRISKAKGGWGSPPDTEFLKLCAYMCVGGGERKHTFKYSLPGGWI